MFRWLICFFIAQYIRFVYLTSHITLDMHPKAREYLRGEVASIFTFWHGCMLMSRSSSAGNIDYTRGRQTPDSFSLSASNRT